MHRIIGACIVVLAIYLVVVLMSRLSKTVEVYFVHSRTCPHCIEARGKWALFVGMSFNDWRVARTEAVEVDSERYKQLVPPDAQNLGFVPHFVVKQGDEFMIVKNGDNLVKELIAAVNIMTMNSR